jgi:hypothetical protein
MAKLVEDYRGVILFLLVFIIMFSLFRNAMVNYNTKLDSVQYNTSINYEE